jgi:pectate lyase
MSLLILSCSSDKEEPIGKWKDNIHLSTKNIELGPGAESVTITTKGEWWWIDAISFNGTIYQYYGSEEIDMETDSYIIIEEAFTFERKNNTTMIISLPENSSEQEVKMSITLQAGNYFDYVSVHQAAQ